MVRASATLRPYLEANCHSSGKIIIDDCCTGSGDPRRPGKTNRALVRFGCLERQPAAVATAAAQELDLGPAIAAKAVDPLDDHPAARAAWRQGEVENEARQRSHSTCNGHGRLSRSEVRRTSAAMVVDLFDMELRSLRRDRAYRRGAELFLHQRAFDDCLDRLSIVRRSFRSALLVGCPDPEWPERLRAFATTVEIIEPGPLFAGAAGATCINEDSWAGKPRSFDLCVAVGTLDSVNDLPGALQSIRSALGEDSLLIGAMAGGDSLPRLRAAMYAADQSMGSASAHVHPRIDGPTLAGLITACGFTMPVIDVDRVRLSYRSLMRLVSDLRSMGATNLLHARSRAPLTRAAMSAAQLDFAAAGDGQRTIEQIEILNFAAWTPATAKHG
jgi:hypothetical protein